MRVCPRCRSIYSVAVDRCGLDGAAIVDQDEDPLVGQTLDRYRVVEPLGRGAMGSVYRAAHTVLVNECAIKVLYGNFALNQRLMERFTREAQAIGRMHHPNVVDVIDFGRTSAGLTFLVMELIEGETLEEAIARDAPFTPERAALIARQIASGLGEAHRRGFIHRDLKPSNVMLTDEHGIEAVKLLDFGVVGLIQASSAAKLTAAGHIVGTPTYMAPEQAKSSSVTPAADLYALGVILYEMLSGRPPFEGSGITEVLLMHLSRAPAPLPEAKGLERIVELLLDKRPERRPASAAEVIAAIDGLDLGTARTEEVFAIRRVDLGRVADQDHLETVEAVTEQHELDALRRAAVGVVEVEHDRTVPEPRGDPALRATPPPLWEADPDSARDEPRGDELPRELDERSAVSGPRERGVVIDPSDRAPPRLVALPIPSPSPVEASRAQLEGPTQLDFRSARPIIDPAMIPLGGSSVDTAPPASPGRAAEVIRDTIRDTPKDQLGRDGGGRGPAAGPPERASHDDTAVDRAGLQVALALVLGLLTAAALLAVGWAWLR